MKTWSRKLHRWLGLFISAYLIVQCLSGLILLYKTELNQVYDETPGNVSTGRQIASLQEVIDGIRRAYPGAQIERITYPSDTGSQFTANLRYADETPSGLLSINYYSAIPVQASTTENLLEFITKLHHDLTFPEFGKYIVGALGSLAMISLGTGLWVWWPGLGRVAKTMKIRFDVGVIRAFYDTHRVIGAVFALLLILSFFTGALMALGPVLRPILGVSFAAPDLVVTEPGESLFDADAIVQTALAAVPNNGIRDVRFRQFPNVPDRIILFRHGPRGSRAGPYQQVWVDPNSNEVRHTITAKNMSLGQAVFVWLFPLHTSAAVGWAGKPLMFATGVAGLLLCVTGPSFWYLRRRRTSNKKVEARSNG